MTDFRPPKRHHPAHVIQQISQQESRKLKAQRKTNQTIWQGFGLFGLIGWAVVVPTLLGTMLGLWLDKHHPINHSWTLSLLVLGLCLGCWQAWYWVGVEKRKIHARERQ